MRAWNARKKFIVLLCLALLPASAFAADVLSPEMAPLGANEQRMVEKIKDWAEHGTGSEGVLIDGKLVFVHGVGGIPTIIAAPLQVVDVELERGEVVNEIVVGDTARWQVVDGTAAGATHLFIKPIDSALETSAVITTDRRVYHLRLISRKTDFTPYVGFLYPDDLKAQVAAARAKEQRKQTWRTDDSGVDLADLNFGYEVAGDNTPWKPERVFDNGRKMYVQLPASATTNEMPALMVRKGRKDVLVNYRVKAGRMMEVDGLFNHLALVAGVGNDQELVEIYRHGTRRDNFGSVGVNDGTGGGGER